SRQKFDKLGISYESSKASYFLARAEASLENPTSAIKALDRALEGFTAEKNAGFVGACYLLRAQLSDDPKRIAGNLARARRGFSKAQLPLWEAIADLHLAASSTRNQAALNRLNKSGAVKRVPHLYAWWQTVLGDRAALKGSHTSAVGHWTRAANRLDTVRAQLPPVEMRSHFGRQESSPHRKLIESTASADPMTAAVWAERYQTAGVWAPVNPVLISDTARRRVEQSLNELAAQVASYSRALPGDSGERGGFSPQAQVTVHRLQQKVRRELAALERTDGRIDEVAELKDKFGNMSQDMPMVQFHLGDSALYAFVHINGKTRCCKYTDGKQKISRTVRQWRFLLERELLTHHLKSVSDIESEERFFRSVGEWLWAPLEIPASAPRVLVIPQGDLANIPWEALIVDSVELGQHHHFTVTPSLRHFARANRIESDSSEVEVFVGESSNLPAVTLELNALLASCGKSGHLHEPASRGTWPTTGTARLWHFAGHSQLRADNPFYSYLSLSDGPLFAADFRIRDVRVGLVTLAACRSGEQVALSGEESTGLVRSLLEMGARNVIAGRWPVSDISTAIWMSRFYGAFFEGESIAEAARLASQQVREKYPSAYHWAAFSVFGAGT
ncbi:MAG TPA: CHAT domain-containing protein, partial [candidate division Zixibacteria bacterium]|nr:CHAT domain-containing protein [candidate division Zixibacteria bacterium]